VIGGKWKEVILHHLMTSGALRFNEIQRLKPNLSPRVLAAQSREFEQDGVIVRMALEFPRSLGANTTVIAEDIPEKVAFKTPAGLVYVEHELERYSFSLPERIHYRVFA
jgi:hypothetical protein